MRLKRTTVRFNLERDEDRQAWEALCAAPGSTNKAIITAINAYYKQADPIAQVIKDTIRECLSRVPFQPVQQGSVEATPDEMAALALLSDFMGE